MSVLKRKFMLRLPQVREEIERYRWLKREHFGHDAGFEEMAQEWIERYADAWGRHYSKKRILKTRIDR